MQKISFKILRLGLAITFLWIGVLIFKDPLAWSSFINPWAVNLFFFDLKSAMLGTAILDILIGILFLINPLVYLAAILGSLHLIIILIVSGINVITVRDIGLLGSTIAVLIAFFPKGKNELYKCPECGFSYKEKEWAKKCESWCGEHHTCNLEIIERAVNKGR